MSLEAIVEILTAEELAQRLKVKLSWVVEAGRAARNSPPYRKNRKAQPLRMEQQEPDRMAHTERIEMKSYSLQKQRGDWLMRWST
jgi:hypothetical protein